MGSETHEVHNISEERNDHMSETTNQTFNKTKITTHHEVYNKHSDGHRFNDGLVNKQNSVNRGVTVI